MGISEREYRAMLRRNGGPDGIAVINDPRATVSLPGASVSGITTDVVAVPTEHEEQVALFQWAEANEAQYPSLAMLAAIPNGGYRPMTTAAMLKAEGVKAGYPDILLDVARGPYHGLRIELKRADRSNHATDAQREWLTKLNFEGYRVAVCYGAQEAIKVITDYLTKI